MTEDTDPDLGRLAKVWHLNERPNLALHLAVLGRLVDRRVSRSLSRYGLNIARWRTIALLSMLEKPTFGELADYAWSDRGDLSRALSRLEQDGLVNREAHPDDRRSFHFSLTEKGFQVYRAFSADWRAVEEEFEGLFANGELDQFNRGLARLAAKSLEMMEEDGKSA